ncbi:hypothetical protein ACHAXS_012416 [Conticribra weissflogii]
MKFAVEHKQGSSKKSTSQAAKQTTWEERTRNISSSTHIVAKHPDMSNATWTKITHFNYLAPINLLRTIIGPIPWFAMIGNVDMSILPFKVRGCAATATATALDRRWTTEAF